MLQAARPFLVEPLEPRLLLSADLIPTEPVAPLQSSPGEQAIVLGLSLQASAVQDNGISGILTHYIAASEIKVPPSFHWGPYTPVAEHTTLIIQTQATGTTAKVTLWFPTGGYRVSGWGTVQQEGNVLVVDAQPEKVTGAIVTQAFMDITHDYDLGTLAPGNYTFVFKAWGQTVESKDFGINVVDGDWISYVPLPQYTAVLAQTQTSGTTTAKLTLTLGRTGYRVQDWGTVRREGKTFYVDAQPQRDVSWPSCFCHHDVTHDYDLGVLEVGTYTFVFEAWGHFVESQDFVMTENGAAQWVPYVPTPEQTTVTFQTLATGTTAKVTLTFPNNGYRITDWGSVHRQYIFGVSAQVEAWTGPRPAETTTFSHDYDLGVLTRGKYTFGFSVGERTVQLVDFIETEGACPVYRFWAPSNNAHFYTISEDEKNNLIVKYPDYWKFEGIAFYAYPEGRQPTGARPVYRFWSPLGKEHFYTTSEAERDWLVANHSSYWTLEGVAFYVDPEGQALPGSKPVYRFWSPVGGMHFYTISEQERNWLAANYSDYWKPEGVAWQTLTLDSFGLTADSQAAGADYQTVFGHPYDLQNVSLPSLPGMRPTDSDPANLAGQVIHLDFDGQRNVTYNGLITVGPFDVPAFQMVDALAGQEQIVIDEVLGRLQSMFANSGVIFTVAKPPAGSDYSTIYVGGDGSPFALYGSFLGLAERIDIANTTRNDDALVFTDRLGGDTPDLDVLIDRLTAIIAHETGHLLGYVHV
jgi:hypothetical protein